MENRNLNQYIAVDADPHEVAHATAAVVAFGAAGKDGVGRVLASEPVAAAIAAGDVGLAAQQAGSVGAATHALIVIESIQAAGAEAAAHN